MFWLSDWLWAAWSCTFESREAPLGSEYCCHHVSFWWRQLNNVSGQGGKENWSMDPRSRGSFGLKQTDCNYQFNLALHFSIKQLQAHLYVAFLRALLLLCAALLVENLSTFQNSAGVVTVAPFQAINRVQMGWNSSVCPEPLTETEKKFILNVFYAPTSFSCSQCPASSEKNAIWTQGLNHQ